VAQRDAIQTAKQVATLDYMSHGRFLFGVGPGWNREEMRNHGTDPSVRFKLMADRVKAMKAIWTQDEATYHGPFTAFDRIWSWPKPVQQPHPPVLVAGNAARVLDRVLDFGNEWLPEPTDDLPDQLGELQRRVKATGGNRPVPVTIYGTAPSEVATWAKMGAGRCVYWLPANDRGAALRRLDELALELRLG
jgi:alkanesulfonate monooxygenase SsuD/methylene tetrahydromethanopterin reductase-like flavin-dependent oxidoreductase (luciferase family)